jgi:hypothetical protein
MISFHCVCPEPVLQVQLTDDQDHMRVRLFLRYKMRVKRVHRRVLKNESHAAATSLRDIMWRHDGIIDIIIGGSQLLGSHHKLGKGAGGHSIE